MARGSVYCFKLVLEGNELKPCIDCCVEVNDEGVVMGVGASRPPGVPTAPAALLPPPCNAHVHVLDYCMVEAGENMDLEELVAHPHGLKYRVLSSLGEHELLEVSALALRTLKRSCWYAAAYAELASKGARALLKASERIGVELRLLVQPITKSLHSYLEALQEFRGLGMDTLYDLRAEELKALRRASTQLKAVIHVHVSETRRLWESRDYELLSVLKPAAAVHGTFFDEDAVRLLESESIAWILCPRSSMYFTGRTADPALVVKAWKRGVVVALGTDNAAWITLNVLLEASYAYTLWRSKVESREELARLLVKAVTVGCAGASGIHCYPVVEDGARAYELAVVEIPELGWSSDPLLTLIKRGYEGRLTSFKSWGRLEGPGC